MTRQCPRYGAAQRNPEDAGPGFDCTLVGAPRSDGAEVMIRN